MKTKNKIPHLILAGLFGTTIASQAARSLTRLTPTGRQSRQHDWSGT